MNDEESPPPSTATTRTAAATPVAAPSMVESAEPIAPAPAQTPADAYVAKDAAAVRAFVSPTAMMNPRGSVSVELSLPAYPLGGMAAARISFHDRFEVGVGGIAMLGNLEDPQGFGVLAAKVQVWRRPTGAVAVQAAYAKTMDQYDDDSVLFTAIGSKCFGDGCRTLVTGHVTLRPHTTWELSNRVGTWVERRALAVAPGLSVVHGRRIKLVLDAGVVGNDGERWSALYGGVRYARPRWAVEVGVVVGEDGDDAEVLPAPLGTVTGRF